MEMMRQFDWQLWAIGGVLLFLGIMIGLLIACCPRQPRRRRRPVEDAPVPADLGYDPLNPMNAGRQRKTVEICGAEWTVMSNEI